MWVADSAEDCFQKGTFGCAHPHINGHSWWLLHRQPLTDVFLNGFCTRSTHGIHYITYIAYVQVFSSLGDDGNCVLDYNSLIYSYTSWHGLTSWYLHQLLGLVARACLITPQMDRSAAPLVVVVDQKHPLVLRHQTLWVAEAPYLQSSQDELACPASRETLVRIFRFGGV